MTDGIYILANDVVVDQLIALVNSIRKNSEKNYPICVIPYDDRLQKTRQYVDSKNNVELLEDESLINRWEKFSTQIWERHPTAIAHWQAKGIEGVNRMGMHRRFCAFEGPFERYIYLDADTLAVGDLDNIFKHLDSFDWVVYDFQYKDLSHVFNVDAPNLTDVFIFHFLYHPFIYKVSEGKYIIVALPWHATLLLFLFPTSGDFGIPLL